MNSYSKSPDTPPQEGHEGTVASSESASDNWSEPISVKEWPIDGDRWIAWSESATKARTTGRLWGFIGASSVTAISAALALTLFPDAERIVVATYVSIIVSITLVTVTSTVRSRVFSPAARSMRDAFTPEPFSHPTAGELQRIALVGGGTIGLDSMAARVESREGGLVLVVTQYALERSPDWNAGSSFTW